MASISSTPSVSSADWTLKPILGEGREKRKEIVEKFFEAIPQTLQQIWEKVKQGELKCRLLYKAKEPEGVAVFSREITNRFETIGFASCLEIKLLSPLSPKRENLAEVYSALIDGMKQEMQQLQGSSILITLSKKLDQAAFPAFAANGFKAVKNGETAEQIRLGFQVQTSANLNGSMAAKRKQEEEKYPESRKRRELAPEREDHGVKRGREREESHTDFKRPRIERAPYAHREEKPLGVTLRKVYIHHIRNRVKTVEGRINSGMFRNLVEGRLVRFFYFQNAMDDVICRVTRITRYSSFRAMLEKEGYKACVPEAYSLENAVQIYDSIPGYTEKAVEHGVLAIQLEVQK